MGCTPDCFTCPLHLTLEVLFTIFYSLSSMSYSRYSFPFFLFVLPPNFQVIHPFSLAFILHALSPFSLSFFLFPTRHLFVQSLRHTCGMLLLTLEHQPSNTCSLQPAPLEAQPPQTPKVANSVSFLKLIHTTTKSLSTCRTLIVPVKSPPWEVSSRTRLPERTIGRR